MRKLTFAVIAVLLLSMLASADDKSDAVATVHKFFDSFNKADVKAAVATCSAQSPVIDEFPPYAWPSCGTWANAFSELAKKNGMSDGHVSMSEPTVTEVNGKYGYVVAPVSFSYKKDGKTVNEPPAAFTAVLEKTGTAWRLKSWTWSR
jgi:SnoaL-like domain